MLRFIVYRYISYKDSKISHASLLSLRHHLSQPPALLPTSQPYDQHLPYYPPHCPTTSTRPTPPCSTTHLTALPPVPALLPTLLYYPPHSPTTSTRPTPLLGYLSYIRLPYLCAHYCLSTTALSPVTHTIPHTAHTCHTPHRPSPPQMYHAAPISYRLYHTALPRTPLSAI